MTLRLLAIAATLALVAVSFGDSGSGSGAANEDCIEPDPRPDPPRQTNRDAYLAMKCHLLCIEKVRFSMGHWVSNLFSVFRLISVIFLVFFNIIIYYIYDAIILLSGQNFLYVDYKYYF